MTMAGPAQTPARTSQMQTLWLLREVQQSIAALDSLNTIDHSGHTFDTLLMELFVEFGFARLQELAKNERVHPEASHAQGVIVLEVVGYDRDKQPEGTGIREIARCVSVVRQACVSVAQNLRFGLGMQQEHASNKA